MKDFYRIKEISRLFEIGPDSLRYYEEIGILKPRRGENGYRQYGMNDIYRLNVIKDLRQIGFSMQRIKEYLYNKTLGNTLELLREEGQAIERKLAELRSAKKSITGRITEIEGYASEKIGVIEKVRCPERYCATHSVRIKRDEEIDFALSRLHKRFGHKLYHISNYMIGATQSVSDVRAGAKGIFNSVFIMVGGKDKEHDSVFPEGLYLSLHYLGAYEQSSGNIDSLIEYADAHGYETKGDILELYKIDVHETRDESEFLTELQIMIEERN